MVQSEVHVGEQPARIKWKLIVFDATIRSKLLCDLEIVHLMSPWQKRQVLSDTDGLRKIGYKFDFFEPR